MLIRPFYLFYCTFMLFYSAFEYNRMDTIYISLSLPYTSMDEIKLITAPPSVGESAPTLFYLHNSKPLCW